MLASEEREEIKRLTRESFELRHANEILKDPSLRPICHGRIEIIAGGRCWSPGLIDRDRVP